MQEAKQWIARVLAVLLINVPDHSYWLTRACSVRSKRLSTTVTVSSRTPTLSRAVEGHAFAQKYIAYPRPIQASIKKWALLQRYRNCPEPHLVTAPSQNAMSQRALSKLQRQYVRGTESVGGASASDLMSFPAGFRQNLRSSSRGC